ncbi:MAG: hypothetical protein ACI9MR_000043 [Myxococcota bacterium]|jgi:hypothetical protein
MDVNEQARRDLYAQLMKDAEAAENEGADTSPDRVRESARVILSSDHDHDEKMRQMRGLSVRITAAVEAMVRDQDEAAESEAETKAVEPVKPSAGSLLPTAPTMPRRSLAGTSTLLYGPPKCGKTSVAASIPGHIILRTEQGQNHVEHFGVDCPDWLTLKRAVGQLSRGGHDFSTIVIDTVDNAILLCKQHVCAELGVSDPADLEYGKGFGAVNSEWASFLRFVGTIDMGVLMLSHAKLADIPDNEGGGSRWSPSIKGGPGRDTLAFVDSIFFVDVARDGTSQVRTRANTSGAGEYVAGSRMAAMADPIPFSWVGFETALTNALAGTSKDN